MTTELWTFKHEPQTLKTMVLSPTKRTLLQKVIDELPNTLIVGNPGTGKGTFMNILLNETQCNYLKINASMETGIDNIRDKVRQFATSYEVGGKKKIVYLNECDRVSPAGQDGLRQLIEDTQHITRFFLLANNENGITDALKSRMSSHISLNDPPGKDLLLFCLRMLKKENVVVSSKKNLVDLIKSCYPDIRKIVGTIQSNVSNGKLEDINISSSSELYTEIVKYMGNNDFDNIRKILKSNFIQYSDLYQYIYERVIDDPDSFTNGGEFILLIGKYMFQDHTVSIKELNFMCLCFDMMKHDIQFIPY